MDQIGIKVQDAKVGEEVYYYDWVDRPNRCHSEPVKTTIIMGAYESSSGGLVCFVAGISGYVLLSHLSKKYYPATLVKLKASEKRYESYLSADFYNSFSDFLGIIKPTLNGRPDGMVRYVSQKYGFCGGWFKLKKDAKADYKQKLKEYKSKNKLR